MFNVLSVIGRRISSCYVYYQNELIVTFLLVAWSCIVILVMHWSCAHTNFSLVDHVFVASWQVLWMETICWFDKHIWQGYFSDWWKFTVNDLSSSPTFSLKISITICCHSYICSHVLEWKPDYIIGPFWLDIWHLDTFFSIMCSYPTTLKCTWCYFFTILNVQCKNLKSFRLNNHIVHKHNYVYIT